MMSINQLMNTFHRILNAKHQNTAIGLIRHMEWQFRKLFSIFPFEINVSQSRLLCNDKKCGVSALINAMGMYDYNNMSIVQELSNDGLIFFDIGANIGIYSLLASEKSMNVVHAFEAHPRTFAKFVTNINLNGRKNIIVNNIAVGNKHGKLMLTDTEYSSTNRIIQDSNKYSNCIEVDCITLNEYCTINNIIPDIIKIDVEGYELPVIDGIGDLLSNVKMLIIEINGLAEDYGYNGNYLLSKITSLFDGPFYLDVVNRKLYRKPINTREDAVFISRNYFSQFIDKYGFTITE